MTQQLVQRGRGDPERPANDGVDLLAPDEDLLASDAMPAGLAAFLRLLGGRNALPDDYKQRLITEVKQGIRDEMRGSPTAGGARAVNYTNQIVTVYHYMTGKAEKCLITQLLAVYEPPRPPRPPHLPASSPRRTPPSGRASSRAS